MTEYLALEDLLALTAELGVGPVRDLGLLESAVRRPATILWGRDAYTTSAEFPGMTKELGSVEPGVALIWVMALLGVWVASPISATRAETGSCGQNGLVRLMTRPWRQRPKSMRR